MIQYNLVTGITSYAFNTGRFFRINCIFCRRWGFIWLYRRGLKAKVITETKEKKTQLCFDLSLVCYQVQCKWDHEIPYVWLKSCKSRVQMLFFRITKAILQHVLLFCFFLFWPSYCCETLVFRFCSGTFLGTLILFLILITRLQVNWKGSNGTILLKIHIWVQNSHSSKRISFHKELNWELSQYL